VRFKGARRIAAYALARFFGFLAFLTAPGKVLNTPPPLEETPLPVPPNENAVPKLDQNAVFHLLGLERSADFPKLLKTLKSEKREWRFGSECGTSKALPTLCDSEPSSRESSQSAFMVIRKPQFSVRGAAG
jgi:hypothetical protein